MSNKKPKPEIDEKGTRLMTEKFVSALCEYNGGYSSPEYNFTCYLHFFAFRRIENLDKFVKKLVSYGLDGIEVYYPYPRWRKYIRFSNPDSIEKIADKYNLIKTGGTDLHGTEL